VDLTRINQYHRDLGPFQRRMKIHRLMVGGRWDEIGRLQFDFMTSQGLLPSSTLLDVGCGALRGGLHFVRYLDDGNYHGIDINKSLLKAGEQELRSAGLNKQVHLHRTDEFDASGFDVQFDFAISVSLLTHVSANQVIYCFMQMRRVMHEASRFYFTFYEVPELPIPDTYPREGNLATHFLSDPFHYTRDQIEYFARSAGLAPHYIGDWGHPSGQQMLELRLPQLL
jgi:SAM-dependent methyltransferase